MKLVIAFTLALSLVGHESNGQGYPEGVGYGEPVGAVEQSYLETEVVGYGEFSQAMQTNFHQHKEALRIIEDALSKASMGYITSSAARARCFLKKGFAAALDEIVNSPVKFEYSFLTYHLVKLGVRLDDNLRFPKMEKFDPLNFDYVNSSPGELDCLQVDQTWSNDPLSNHADILLARLPLGGQKPGALFTLAKLIVREAWSYDVNHLYPFYSKVPSDYWSCKPQTHGGACGSYAPKYPYWRHPNFNAGSTYVSEIGRVLSLIDHKNMSNPLYEMIAYQHVTAFAANMLPWNNTNESLLWVSDNFRRFSLAVLTSTNLVKSSLYGPNEKSIPSQFGHVRDQYFDDLICLRRQMNYYASKNSCSSCWHHKSPLPYGKVKYFNP